VAIELDQEFPGLRAEWRRCICSDNRCDAGVGERLDTLASRFSGRQAIELRQQQIPAAYRSFYRQIGIDPDLEPTHVEQAALSRLLAGGNRQSDRISDALLLALLETSVPVFAFEAAAVAPPVEIRQALAGELAGGADLPPGTLILADRERALCQLFEQPDVAMAVTGKGAEILLVAVAVPGVSAIASDEALTIAAEAISGS